MHRRAFIGTVAASVLTTPLGGWAQPAKKTPRVALVFIAIPVANMAGTEPTNQLARAFVHGLRDLGWIDGRNIVIERRSAEGRPDRMPALMRELVASNIDVIVTTDPVEAQRASDSISIVGLLDNPVYERLVANLARPERNITGVGAEADPAINGKRLQLLKEVAPKASRIALISNSHDSATGIPVWRPETEAAARALGLTLTRVSVDTVEQFEPAFAVLERDRPHGLLVDDSPANYSHPRLIADFAARQKIPALYSRREFVDAGGLMSYGANFSDQMRRVAVLVDKILKGAKPGDLPVELPTKLELVINSKAANALGITMPQSLLLLADEVTQ